MPRARYWLIALTGIAVAIAVVAFIQVARRVAFPYDFMIMADDYVLNEMIKLRLGAPLYGSYADANTFIYSPGLPLLHRMLLAPLGLDLSVVANRVLSQLWLAGAIFLGVALVPRISVGKLEGRFDSILSAMGATAFLVLAGYANAVAESLHPANLELLLLVAAATVAARWPSLSPRARLLSALFLPALGLLTKQTGASMGLSLAIVAIVSPGRTGDRFFVAAVSLLSPVLAFLTLQLATRGAFVHWGLILPIRQQIFLGQSVYLVMWLGSVGPLLSLVALGLAPARQELRTGQRAAWLRAGLIPVCHGPLAIPAMLKIGGGPYDFGAIGFLLAILGLALLLESLSRDTARFSPLGLGLIAGIQLFLWAPHRLVPNAADHLAAESLCAHVSHAVQCGERILVDEGAACLAKAGVTEVPKDRLFSIVELDWAGISLERGTIKRIRSEEYDVLAFHSFPPPFVWPAGLVSALNEHYEPYVTLPAGQISNAVYFENWQNLQPGAVLFERKRDHGRHSKTIETGSDCAPARAASGEPH